MIKILADSIQVSKAAYGITQEVAVMLTNQLAELQEGKSNHEKLVECAERAVPMLLDVMHLAESVGKRLKQAADMWDDTVGF